MGQIKLAADRIAERFHPRRITLFGSYAYGSPTKNSDVDLLILMDGKHVHDQALRIRLAVDFDFPVDLLVRSPAEMTRRVAWGDSFLKEIRDKGKILYDAADARVDRKSRRRLRHGPARTPGKKIAELR